MTSAPGGSGKCSPAGRPSPVSEGVAAWACVLREDASRQSSALKLHQTSGLRCPHRVKPALAFASRTGDRAQTRVTQGPSCALSVLATACQAVQCSRRLTPSVTSRRASAPARPRRGRRSATRPSSLRVAFRLVPRLVTLREQQHDTATDARHEAWSRDIFPGHLVDTDCRPVMSGLCDPTSGGSKMAELPAPPEGIALAHFIVSADIERSRRFYTEVLGGRVAFSGPGGLTYVALSNSWIIINTGGGPTDDKPAVTLQTPRDPEPGQQLPQYPGQRHPRRVRRMERPRRPLPDTAQTAPVRDPLLHPRPRRPPHRSRPNHRPRRRLDTRPLALQHTRRDVRVKAETTSQ